MNLISADQPPHVPEAMQGLPRLRERPRYVSGGLASPSVLLPALAVAGLLFLTGALSAVLLDWLIDGRIRFGRLIIPFGLALVSMTAGIPAIRIGRVRRPWVATGLNLFWAAAFIGAMDLCGGTRAWYALLSVVPGLDDGEAGRLILLLIVTVAVAAVGFQVNGADAYRVYYERPNCWAEQAIAFYKANSGRKVLQALEFGNPRPLLELRGDGPSAGHSWQSFTALVLYTCPGHPEEPAYLYLKDVAMGGGPFYSTRFQTCQGTTHLRCVRLNSDDLEVLYRLEPRLTDPVASGRPESELGRAARTGSRTPTGLPSGAPADVASAGGSWIRTLEPGEQRRLRAWHSLGTYASLLSLPLIFGFGFLATFALEGNSPAPSGPRTASGAELIAVIVFLGMLVGSLILAVFQPVLCRALVRRALRSRRASRVADNPEGIYIRVEDTRTFHKMKVMADDAGIMRIGADGVDLELSRQIIHLEPSEVQAGIRQVPGGIGLALSARFGEWPWSITVAPMLKTFFWEAFTDMRPRLEELKQEIRRISAPKPPPLPPLSGREV